MRRLGETLGFVSEDERAIGRQFVAGAYRPRLDATWSVDLVAAGFDLSWVATLTGNPAAKLYPVVGAEVEVGRPTTKRHFSNLANLALARLPYSLLVVDVQGEADMYRRANRAVRSFNHRYGMHDAIAVDIGQLPSVVNGVSAREIVRSAAPRVHGQGGTGGESADTRELRRLLIDRGLRGGFVVVNDAEDPRARTDFAELARLAPDALDVPWAPGQGRRARTASQFWTASRPDVVWAIEPGASLKGFVGEVSAVVGGSALYARFGPVPDLLPVVSFELERSGGKHAAGALFTLAAQPGVGIVVATRYADVDSMHRSHARVVGAGHVSVLSEDTIREMMA